MFLLGSLLLTAAACGGTTKKAAASTAAYVMKNKTVGDVHPQLEGPFPVPLDEAYRRKTAVRAFASQPVGLSWAEKNPDRVRPRAYYSVRTARNCTFPINLMILMDATASTKNDRHTRIAAAVPSLLDMLNEQHPGSQVGLMSFKDKPIPFFGWEGDYCERMDVPLGKIDANAIQSAVDGLWINGGGDPAENQFGAMIELMFQAEWTTPDAAATNASSNIAANIIVMFTDNQPHHKDDGLDKGYKFGEFDPASSQDQRCTGQYYPHPDQVMNAQQDAEAYLISVVFGGQLANALPIRSWQWYNGELGQPDEFVVDADTVDLDSIWDKISEIISSMKHVECNQEEAVTTPPLTEECINPTDVICDDPERDLVVVVKKLRHRGTD